MLVFGRAVHVGLVALAAALIALILGDAPLGAQSASRGEGHIAFTFGESGAVHPAQLAVMDGDGKNRRALPPDDVHGGLSWSPDGRLIAFSAIAFSGSAYRFGVYTINVDRRKYRRVVRNGFLPAWSPNGRSIAFQRGGNVFLHPGDIWVFNLNDRRQRRVIRNGSSPRWSPDGRKLAFTRGRRPDLWVLDVAAKKERRLVSNGEAANWSADGRQIAFERCRPPRSSECFIYVMRSDGTNQRRLFEGNEPTWSPDGQALAFIGKAGGRYDAIIRARLDGSGRRVLFGETPYCGCGSLDWSAG